MNPSIIIHRGTHQIGGCITEIRTNTSRIIIDFGSNLPGTDHLSSKSDEQLVEEVFGHRACKAVLFTHYHGDHIGLYKMIPPGIPLYIGATAKKILTVLTEKLDGISEAKGLPIIKTMNTYSIGKWITFGDIRVKPLLVDHSALDSYMFLIKAAGKTILFTGDFREHGIAGENNRLERMLKTYGESNIDILITEGTMLSRIDENKAGEIITEEDLGRKAREIFGKVENKHIFVLVSSTNLDSIMEFYHAVPEDMAFACDAYQAEIMKIAMDDKGTYYRKYKPAYIRNRRRNIYVVGDKAMKGLNREEGFWPADFDKMREKGFVMLIRANDKFEEILRRFADVNPLIIYSMWRGYLHGKCKDEKLVEFLGNYRTEYLHTSGHAYITSIRKVIDTVKPKIIIPMHTECADTLKTLDEFSAYADRIKAYKDGDIIEV
jgi:ribonuclease J